MNLIIKNSIKSLAVLVVSALLFVILMTIFPLIGSLTMKNFPVQKIVFDNLELLFPMILASVLVSPVYGWLASKLAQKRFLYLFPAVFFSCWLFSVAVMYCWMKFFISSEDLMPALWISFWATLVYLSFSLPVFIPAVWVIEKWTRK
ncbi:MAG TPA: hypothetical protein VII99_06230 [Bacteroidia bacterium]